MHLIFQSMDLASELRKNTNSDLSNILEWTKKLMPLMLNKTHSGLLITNFQLWLKMNIEKCSERRVQFKNLIKLSILILKIYQLLLTGELKALLMLFKTKDNVVHAGLSHQLQPWKELISLKLDPYLNFLNNNLLIVIHNQVDVTEVLKLGLLNT